MPAAVLGIGLKAFLIGFTGAMAPGPVLTVTITETVRRGKRAAIMLMVGHAILEIFLIVAVIFGLQLVLRNESVAMAISVGGGAFLIWMGVSLLRDVIGRRVSLDLTDHGERPAHGPIMDGIATSLSNPYFTIWWATIGATLVLEAIAIGPAGLIAFYIGHEGADFAWYGAVIAAVSKGKRFITPKVYRGLLGTLAALVLLLGVYYVGSSVLTLTGVLA